MAKAVDRTSTPPARDSALTLEDLIAFGRDYLKEIEANEATEASARIPIDLPLNVLKQYLARSIEGLALLQAEQARKTPKKRSSSGGRPRGTLGDEVIRLMANGAPEHLALRAVAENHGKSQASVKRSYKDACKKLKP